MDLVGFSVEIRAIVIQFGIFDRIAGFVDFRNFKAFVVVTIGFSSLFLIAKVAEESVLEVHYWQFILAVNLD